MDELGHKAGRVTVAAGSGLNERLGVMLMTELVARQAKQLEELRDENKDLKERARKARLHITCIGGPLNDNKLGYTREQMGTFQRIMDALEEDNRDYEDA